MSDPTTLKPVNSSLILGLIAVTLVLLGIAQAINATPHNETGPFASSSPQVSSPALISEAPAVLINGARFSIEIADTPEARAQGLSGRSSLAPNTGLLFIFDTPGRPGFWMKDMIFPIDIIWLSAQGTVAQVTENFTPNSYPEIIYPKQDVTRVLEVPAGSAATFQIKTGDSFSILGVEKSL
jgi:uncharacterized membrane protein (UPF0127 family)